MYRGSFGLACWLRWRIDIAPLGSLHSLNLRQTSQSDEINGFGMFSCTTGFGAHSPLHYLDPVRHRRLDHRCPFTGAFALSTLIGLQNN